MEQQEQTRHKQLNIHLKKDGELNLSGLTLENLTTEEFLVVQQLIDESKVRSQSNRQIEELMQRGMMAQTAIAAKRRVADYVNRLPLSERPRWIAEYQLQGLVTLPEPPAQQLPPRPGIPNPDIADIDEGSVQSVINPGAMKILQAIAANYPDYIRIDGAWIDELCDAASNQNMTLRSNHHFYISGGTQSGKSTLAGVIINKIAAKSQSPAIVIGSDPKDEVTRWLCKFSRKFDGMKALRNWITFATDMIDQQKARVAKVGGECHGVPELLFAQDEVDSVYGGGKGLPGMVDADTAKDLQGFWNYIIKFTAGLKGHGLFIGQSPLSGETGFSRPSLKNVCFIAMGQTSSYILDVCPRTL